MEYIDSIKKRLYISMELNTSYYQSSRSYSICFLCQILHRTSHWNTEEELLQYLTPVPGKHRQPEVSSSETFCLGIIARSSPIACQNLMSQNATLNVFVQLPDAGTSSRQRIKVVLHGSLCNCTRKAPSDLWCSDK